MTIRQLVHKRLYERGMFDDQATAVIARAEASNLLKPTAGRWDDPAANYPTCLLITIYISVDRIALEWIDENFPKAWYRPLFAKEPTDEEA